MAELGFKSNVPAGGGRSLAVWLLGEEAGRHPTKRDPRGYGIIFIGFPEWR